MGSPGHCGLLLQQPVIPPLERTGQQNAARAQPSKPEDCSITLMPPLGWQAGVTQLGKLWSYFKVYKHLTIQYSSLCGTYKGENNCVSILPTSVHNQVNAFFLLVWHFDSQLTLWPASTNNIEHHQDHIENPAYAVMLIASYKDCAWKFAEQKQLMTESLRWENMMVKMIIWSFPWVVGWKSIQTHS